MNDGKILEETERYLNGEMSADERNAFEALSQNDSAAAQKIAEHRDFLKLLKQYSDRLALETRLNAIHDEIDVHTLTDELMVHPSGIVRLWRNHHSKISVAASIAIFAALFTMFISGNLNNHDAKMEQLRQEVGALKRKTDGMNNTINKINPQLVKATPEKYRGTGFAITSDGLVATDYHVIMGNDSVYVQNAAGKSFKAKVLYIEPESDIAILKITDTTFKSLAPIPYTIKRSESDLAENVYTYGYPQISPRYGSGDLTAANGINTDSVDYEISIPVNTGNSGGPLLDSRGNIIGMVRGKETELEGVSFAVKSAYLLNAIDSVSKQDTKVMLNTKNAMSNLSTVQQVKKLKNYVFMVKVYAK
jgi:serine protease Do